MKRKKTCAAPRLSRAVIFQKESWLRSSTAFKKRKQKLINKSLRDAMFFFFLLHLSQISWFVQAVLVGLMRASLCTDTTMVMMKKDGRRHGK